jgi:RHS repeat-associated protein
VESGSGSCGQNTPQTGFWTKYTYDPLNNLTVVTQNAQSGSTQTRSYSYDAMGRLTSESNPESGTKNYVYDSDSTMCGNGAYTSAGDLVKIVDAAGNCVMRYYDALHRITDLGSPTGCKRFRYDGTNGVLGSKPSGVSVSNTQSRLAEAETDSCASPITQSSIIADEWFSYTARGEVSDVYQATPHSGGYYHTTQSYWPNGLPDVLGNNIAGLPTFTYTPDGEGRAYTVSASAGQNPVTNTVYNPASLPTAVTYGSADSDSFNYDSNTNRMTQYQFNVNGSSLAGILGWNANGTLQTQNITDAFNGADTQNCSYGYDDVTRLRTANCGTAAAQTFTYDAFGNINKSGSPFSFTPTYSSATNRMTSINGFTPTYDNNGNVLNDNLHTYTWNSDNLPTTVDSVNLTYDASGRMVEQNRSGVYTQIVYAPGGQKFALMNGQTLQKAFVPLPGGGQTVYNSSGLLYYAHTDHLGSSRFASTPSRTVYFDMAYAPFGETYAASGSTDASFTTQRQDTVAGLYDFPAREYSYQGRWSSPDPAGLAAVDPTYPQSWNRYAYVMGNPLGLTDPSGLGPRRGHPRIPPRQGTDCTNSQTLIGGSGPVTCNGFGGCFIDGAPSTCGTVLSIAGTGMGGSRLGFLQPTGFVPVEGTTWDGEPIVSWVPVFGNWDPFLWYDGTGRGGQSGRDNKFQGYMACMAQAEADKNLAPAAGEMVVGGGTILTIVGLADASLPAFYAEAGEAKTLLQALWSGFEAFDMTGRFALFTIPGFGAYAKGIYDATVTLDVYDNNVANCQASFGYPNVR